MENAILSPPQPTIMSENKTLHIVIAEDKPRLAALMRENVELAPDLRVLWMAPNGDVLLKQLASAETLPDLILMDIQMPIMNGILATEAVKKAYPQIRIVMATVFDDKQHIFDAILMGADGYLLKDEDPGRIHHSIREAIAGGAPMSPAIARKALEMMRMGSQVPADTPDLAGVLTPRELEILEQVAAGLSYKQVGEKLFIATGTVRKHVENIYGKLQVNNKVSAVELARRGGLL